MSSARRNAWRGSEVITASVLSSTRNSAIDFALFSCHQAEPRLCSSKSCIRKMSAEDLLHLHILFRELTGLARPNVVGQCIVFLIDCCKSVVMPGSDCPEREGVLCQVSYRVSAVL